MLERKTIQEKNTKHSLIQAYIENLDPLGKKLWECLRKYIKI